MSDRISSTSALRSVTNEALIQAKDSETATNKPHNFLSKKTCSQIVDLFENTLNKLIEMEFNLSGYFHIHCIIAHRGMGGHYYAASAEQLEGRRCHSRFIESYKYSR